MGKRIIYIVVFLLVFTFLPFAASEADAEFLPNRISEVTFKEMTSEEGQYHAAACILEDFSLAYPEDLGKIIAELKEGKAAAASMSSEKNKLFMIYICTTEKCHMIVYSFDDDVYRYSPEANRGWVPNEDVLGVCNYYKTKGICDSSSILEPGILLDTYDLLEKDNTEQADSNNSIATETNSDLTDSNHNRSIAFESYDVYVEKGRKITLVPEIIRNDESAPDTTNCVFSSDDESIASVNNGQVTGVAVGSCNIYCKAEDDESIMTAVRLNVFNKIKSMKSDINKITLAAGDTKKVEITYAPEEGIIRDLEWNSSNEEVAVVDNLGLIEAKKYGDAVITAKTTDGSNLAIKINVHVPTFYIQNDSYSVDNPTGLLLPITFSEISVSDLQISIDKKTKCFSYTITGDEKIRIVPIVVGEGTINFKYGKDNQTIKITVNHSAIDMSKYKNAEYLLFGHYEQDQSQNGKEPIEWEISEISDTTVMLVSRYILDCQPYDTKAKEGVKWEDASLCKWLNGTFKNAAFSKEEQKALIEGVGLPENTWTEADIKSSGNWYRIKELTGYAARMAEKQGAYKGVSGAYMYWTYGGGDIDDRGKSYRGVGGSGMTTKYVGVVPVICVDLSLIEAEVVK